MGIDAIPQLTQTLHQVEFHNKDNGACVVEGDPETTVSRLTFAALSLNSLVVGEFGGRIGGERERGLTNSVVAAAFQTFGEEEPYPTPFDKAAVLIRGITGGHPFVDGNKRTGFLTAAFYLSQAGIPIPEGLPTERMYDLCMQISSGELRDLHKIVERLRGIWTTQAQSKESPSE